MHDYVLTPYTRLTVHRLYKLCCCRVVAGICRHKDTLQAAQTAQPRPGPVKPRPSAIERKERVQRR